MATCSYNGVTFTTLYKSRISSRPVLDEAQRTVVYVEHTLEIDGYITPSINSVDAKWEIIRQDLTAVGGELLYYDKGFGELIVNSTLRLVRDVKWGPIPEIVDFYPLGGDCNAARIRWRCTTRIPECSDAKYQKRILAYNYDATYEIDQDGYTKLRVSGYIEIPMTRNTVRTRTLPDSVDRYREMVERTVPLGFQRKQQTYRISPDKRRLDFSYTDEELAHAFPENVTTIQARHRIDSSGVTYVKKVLTLTATITMAPARAQSESLYVFLLMLASKTTDLVRKIDKLVILPKEFSIDNELFGRTTSYVWRGEIVSAESLETILNHSGMWMPFATDSARWRTSMKNTGVSSSRGDNPGMKLTSDLAAIVDLCVSGNDPGSGGGSTAGSLPGPGDSKNASPSRPNPSIPSDFSVKAGWDDRRKPQNSWLEYENSLEYSEEPGVVVHQTLPRDPPGSGGGSAPPGAGNPGGTGIPPGKFVVGPPIGGGAAAMPDAAGSASGIRNATSTGATTPQGSAPPAVIQYRSATMRYVRMRGYAARLGWKPVVPRLVSVGGQVPVEIKRVVSEGKSGGTPVHPVFEVDWIIDYVLPVSPSSLPHLANPVYDYGGGVGSQQTRTP